MRFVQQEFPQYLLRDGEYIILDRVNEQRHHSSDVYMWDAQQRKWIFMRPASSHDLNDAMVEARYAPGALAVTEANIERVAFSWLSTKQVCQSWSAAFAAYPHDGRTH